MSRSGCIPVAGTAAAPPLSAACRSNGLLFVSGTPGYTPDGHIAEGDFAAQFVQAVATLTDVLARGGSSLRHVVKVNVLLVRHEDVPTMNALYASAFGPAPYPARTTCVVAALPDRRMLLELECVAGLTSASADAGNA